MLSLTSLFKHTYQNIKVRGQILGLFCLDNIALLGGYAARSSILGQRGGSGGLTHLMGIVSEGRGPRIIQMSV